MPTETLVYCYLIFYFPPGHYSGAKSSCSLHLGEA